MKLFFMLFLFNSYIFSLTYNFTSDDKDLNLNLELLNDFYINNSDSNLIKLTVEKLNENYLSGNTSVIDKKNILKLFLFMVNNINLDEINFVKITDLVSIKNNDKNINDYAKNIYFLYEKNLIKGAEIAFSDNISIKDLELLSINNYYGVDTVYNYNEKSNFYLIDLIFSKIIEKSPDVLLKSNYLGLSLPISIWFHFILADQKIKNAPNDKLDNNNYINNLLLANLSFTKKDFNIIKKSFKSILSTQNLLNFKEKNNFFIIEYINFIDDKNNVKNLYKYIFEKIINSELIYFDSIFKTKLLSLFNQHVDNLKNKMSEITNLVAKEYSDEIFKLFAREYLYDKKINDLIKNEKYKYFNALNEAIKTKYVFLGQQFFLKINNKIDLKQAIKLLDEYDYLFPEQIGVINKHIFKNLNEEDSIKYENFKNSFNYNQFNNLNIVDYYYSFDSDFLKIKSYRYNIELYKLIFLKLINDKIIKRDWSVEQVFNEINKYCKIKINNTVVNIFDIHNLYISDIDKLSYKTKSKSLSGIDIFIFNKYLYESYIKVFFASDSKDFRSLNLSSKKLGLKLEVIEWYFLIETIRRVPRERPEFIDNFFEKFIGKHKTLEDFIIYNNQHPFLDNYIFDDNKVSLREKLIRHYLYLENKNIIDSLNNNINEDDKAILKNNFDLFLSKITYEVKILVKQDLSILKEQDKQIVDNYFNKIIKKNNCTNFTKNKKYQKNTVKKVNNKKNIIIKINNKADNKKEEKNIKLENNTSKNIKKIKLIKKNNNKVLPVKNNKVVNSDKDNKKSNKNNNILESINYLRYKLEDQKNNFINWRNNNYNSEKKEITKVKKINKRKKKSNLTQPVKNFFNAFKYTMTSNMPIISQPSLFYSQNKFNSVFEKHKNFLNNEIKSEEEYANIVKEISTNFYNNIMAIDEFIEVLLYEKSFNDYQERNNLVFHAWQIMHHVFSTPLSQEIKYANLAEQISNAFYRLENFYQQFFDLVYSNSEYYNFSQQLLNIDKTITKDDLANLMTWADTEIKYKQTLQELSSLISITYKDIIECSKQLHFMINNNNN